MMKLFFVTLTVMCQVSIVLAGPVPRTDNTPWVPPGGRVRANALIRMAVPEPNASEPVIIDILDPHGQRVWTGASRDPHFECFTRDWTDGVYTVRFQPGGDRQIRVDTTFFGQVRARCGVMLRELEKRRDADGLPPKPLAGASNLLQRILTQFVWQLPDDHVTGNLAFCEQQLGFKTGCATARILGSGASEYKGYDGPYVRHQRERTMMFMPPNAVVDFAANAERKMERWGYGPEDVEHVLITHEHLDHFDPEAIANFAEKRRQTGSTPLVVHSGHTVCRQLREYLAQHKKPDRLVLIDELVPGQETQAGELRVKTVLATHRADPDPMCFIMRWRGTTVYYGTDSGYPSAETLAALSAERFDIFAHDTTVASADDGVTHSDVGDLLLLVGKLRAAGAIDMWTRVVTLHQSPEGPQIIPDISQFERMAGFECSFDGMPIPLAYRINATVK